jgi:hypothetical protein
VRAFDGQSHVDFSLRLFNLTTPISLFERRARIAGCRGHLRAAAALNGALAVLFLVLVLLTPAAVTAAFPHDHNPNRDERRRADQLFAKYRGSAQVVRLGHRGTPSLDAATKLPFLAARPIASLGPP